MYDFIQIIFKIILTFLVGYIAILLLTDVWKVDIDLKKLVNPISIINNRTSETISFLPSINQNAFYQNGQLVAEVRGEKIDLKNKTITFAEVKSFSLNLDENLDYRKYRLQIGTTGLGQESVIHKKETLDKRVTGGYDAFYSEIRFNITTVRQLIE